MQNIYFSSQIAIEEISFACFTTLVISTAGVNAKAAKGHGHGANNSSAW